MSGPRLEPLAVLIVNPCGNASPLTQGGSGYGQGGYDKKPQLTESQL
jgi:hypothetical protein